MTNKLPESKAFAGADSWCLISAARCNWLPRRGCGSLLQRKGSKPTAVFARRPYGVNLRGKLDAHSGFGDFDDCDSFGSAAGSRPDL